MDFCLDRFSPRSDGIVDSQTAKLEPGNTYDPLESTSKMSSSSIADAPTGDPAFKQKRTWYHTTLFNAFVIGGVGFIAPGLWNAMNNLGAGGAQEPYLVNAANSLVFAIMGFMCLFGAPLANSIGLRWTLFLGAVGYPVYSAGLYANNRYGNTWLVLVGAVACGLSAGGTTPFI